MGSISKAFEMRYCQTQMQRLDGIIQDIVNYKTDLETKITEMTAETEGLDPNSPQIRALKVQMDKWRIVLNKLDNKLSDYKNLYEVYSKRKMIADQDYRQMVQKEYSYSLSA